MLNEFIVVESAVSAFNNAALWAPAFLWWTGLALPLFIITFWCSDIILKRIGWTSDNILNKSSLWIAGLTCVWIVLFGGNYAVLRDTLSVLPLMVAMIVFLTTLFISSHLRDMPLPKMNWRRWVAVIFILMAVGMSDTHAWWGPILQIGAFVAGCVLGRIAKGKMRPAGGIILIMMMVAIAMLMQPEFFRFGQLGHLTTLHLMAVLGLGCACMATVAIQNINSRAKIRHSVYIKLKWLMRVICVLGIALFMLTEAVPIFIGTMTAVFLSVAMSVWHAEKKFDALGDKIFSIALMAFGAITVMPVITAIGILYWTTVPYVNFWTESKRLL